MSSCARRFGVNTIGQVLNREDENQDIKRWTEGLPRLMQEPVWMAVVAVRESAYDLKMSKLRFESLEWE